MLPNLDITQLLGLLALMLACGKVFGYLARRLGQPPLLGEMVAGLVLGSSLLRVVNTNAPGLHAIAELGLVIFLFQVGLELDVRQVLPVLPEATLVAVVGVLAPFLLGYVVCVTARLDNHVAIGAGAAITATSLGVTARLLSDLNRLEQPESQIILWAAILGNIFGLVLLGVVGSLAGSEDATLLDVVWTSAVAYGFLVAALAIGGLVVPWLFRLVELVELPGTALALALTIALAMAWLAGWAGVPRIIGAFFAGVLVGWFPHSKQVEQEIVPLEQVLVSIAFVFAGAQIDLHTLSPWHTGSSAVLVVGILLTLAAIAGKYASGYAPWWFQGNKRAIGVGMVVHGEIGIVFAQIGLAHRVFDTDLFSAVCFMVMVTTFGGIAVLQAIYPPLPAANQETTPVVEAAKAT